MGVFVVREELRMMQGAHPGPVISICTVFGSKERPLIVTANCAFGDGALGTVVKLVIVGVDAEPDSIATTRPPSRMYSFEGIEAPTLNAAGKDVPPPGAGFVTVTMGVAVVARSAAVTATDSWVGLTNVVVRDCPPNLAVAVRMKLLPDTPSEKAADPAGVEAGESADIVGVGLVEIKNVEVLDVPPPGAGFTTVTDAVPPVARSDAVIAAVNCDALP